MKIDNDGGSMDVSGLTSTLYASFFPSQRTNIDVIQSFNYQDFSTSRRIIFGQTDAAADSSTNSSLYMGSLGFGYAAVNSGSFTWTPDSQQVIYNSKPIVKQGGVINSES